MPIHDWTRVDAGLFHNFHQRWISALCDAFNTGGLPRNYFALAEQSISGPLPDVLTLYLSPPAETPGDSPAPVATAPPRTRLVRRSEAVAEGLELMRKAKGLLMRLGEEFPDVPQYRRDCVLAPNPATQTPSCRLS